MEKLKTVIITQARTGSTRLPNKVLLKIQGKSLLDIHLERISKSKMAEQLIVATTTEASDQQIVDLCKSTGVAVSRGSVDDVLDRFYQAAKDIRPQWVVRVTSDCPLLDPAMIDAVIATAQVNDVDYCSNTLIEHFPDGQDVEVFKFAALEEAWQNATLKSDREHVTPYIRDNSDLNGQNLFKAINFPSKQDFSEIRMTVDEPRDFELISTIIENMGTDKTWYEYTKYVLTQNLTAINGGILRNEGLIKSLKND